jgi:hypothetical protein
MYNLLPNPRRIYLVCCIAYCLGIIFNFHLLPNYTMNNQKQSLPLTRSASSSSSKSNTSSTLKSIPSIDEVLKAISSKRSTQNKLLTKQDALGDELKLRLDALTSRFDAILVEIVDLRNQVSYQIC